MKEERKKGRLRAFIKRHKLLTVIISLVLVAAIAVSSIVVAGNKTSQAAYSFIRTTTLAKGTLEDTITATGTVKSAKTSNVTTSLNYTIKSISVAVGDTVKKGDTICTLDTSELEAQIEKEESNLSKTKASAQSSYNSAKAAYDNAKSTLDSYASTYSEAKSAYESAKTPYSKAQTNLKSYQNAYDSALSAYNKAGSAYIKALSNYNSTLSKYNSKKSTSNKTKLISAAKAYMKAVQNYYGNCSAGSYDISDSSSSAASSLQGAESDKAGGNTASSSVSASSVNVTQTADEICSSVISKMKSVAGITLTKPSGTNTLYKLANKASALRSAKDICNYSSLESAYSSAESAYNEAKQVYSQYKNEVSQAKDQLDKASEELENASSSDTLDDLKSQLDECSLKAEQSGTVTALNATVGSSVNMDSAVATIQDTDNLTVSITIEEADINNVELGMTCRVTSDASDTALSGTLTQIDPVSNEGSFGATVKINDKSDDIYIGMNASVDIIVSTSEEVYQVPIDAVGTENNSNYVYRQTGGSGTDMEFEKVTVTTGESNDYYIEISSDELSEGDVVRSSADLSEGIETVSDSEKEEKSTGGLFSNLFGSGNNRGGDMPQGGPSGNNSKSQNSNSSGDGMGAPPSGGMPGGNNG